MVSARLQERHNLGGRARQSIGRKVLFNCFQIGQHVLQRAPRDGNIHVRNSTKRVSSTIRRAYGTSSRRRLRPVPDR